MMRRKVAAVRRGGQADVPSCLHSQTVACVDCRRLRLHILPGSQQHRPRTVHRTAHMLSGGLFQPVILVPRQIIADGGRHRVKVQIASGVQHRLAQASAVDDLPTGQGDIPSGAERKFALFALNVNAPHPVQSGAGKAVLPGRALRAARGGDDIDIASGARQHRIITGYHSGNIVDIRTRQQADIRPVNGARFIGDILRAELYRLAPVYRAAVQQVAAQVHRHLSPTQQRARTVDIPLLHPHIHLRHQHRLPGSVRQHHIGVHQPHHIFR